MLTRKLDKKYRFILMGMFLLYGGMYLYAAASRMVFYIGRQTAAIPLVALDSMLVHSNRTATLFLHQGHFISVNEIDSMEVDSLTEDTLHLVFHGNNVDVCNPRLDLISVEKDALRADVKVVAHDMPGLVISAIGHSDDGCISVDADTSFTFRMDNLELKSSHAPSFNSTGNKKVTFELADNSTNRLEDAWEYVFADSTQNANGCINVMGKMDVCGTGHLYLSAHKKHGIYVKKSLHLADGNITIQTAASDAIHSGKKIQVSGGFVSISGMSQDGIDADEDFQMESGQVEISLTGDGYKGIKCKKNMSLMGGSIRATATGGIVDKQGDLSYCTLLKCDGNMWLHDADIQLTHMGAGGKCISCNGNLTIEGGEYEFETTGDGASYINQDGETDYYTAKCVAVDDSLRIISGRIGCRSTGLGGKGIVSGNYMEIGMPSDTISTEEPTIIVSTHGNCIVNNEDEDKRFGCPKAIKVDSLMNIFSGSIICSTDSMGGEGIECNDEMYMYGGQVECMTYDDGINVAHKIEVLGGLLYCNSIDNDGIDSNGSIYLKGGIIASVNQKKPNESLDSEDRQCFLQGATVFGIGSSSVKLDNQECCYYNTLYNNDPDKPVRRGLRLTTGKYIYLMKGNQVVMALLNENQARRGFVTVASPTFREGERFILSQGECPIHFNQSLFGNRFLIGGEAVNTSEITEICTSKERQY